MRTTSYLKTDPYNLVTRTGRAQVLREVGRLPEALHELNTIVHDYPKDIIPSFARAEVVREMGDFEKAELGNAVLDR